MGGVGRDRGGTAGGSTWTVGPAHCAGLPSRVFGVRLTSTMPSPPGPARPRPTSRSGRPLRGRTPRSSPAVFAGSRLFGAHAVAFAAVCPPSHDGCTSGRGAGPTGSSTEVRDAGVRLAVAQGTPCRRTARSCCAPTVVTQGEVLCTVEAPGPELPAEVATKMPADAAARNASWTGAVGSSAGADREVDHVDAVTDRCVDRRQDVGVVRAGLGRALGLPARPCRPRSSRAGATPEMRTEVAVVHNGPHPVVADGDRGGVASVALAVARGHDVVALGRPGTRLSQVSPK